MDGAAGVSFLTPEHARTLPMPEKLTLGQAIFTPDRVSTLRTLLGTFDADGKVDTPDNRVDYEWNQRVMARPLSYVPLGALDPWHIDEHYGADGSSNAEQLEIVNTDFEAAVDLALRYQVTGNLAAGAAVVRILSAWARLSGFDTNAGSVLNWNNKWPLMIQAALMVKDHPEYIEPVRAALQDTTRRGLAINTAITHDNNWGAWGCTYLFAAAIFLEDRRLFDRALQRWRTLFDIAVVGNVPVFEIYRQGSGSGDGSYGLWYSNFFMSGMTIAAEWARFGGAWLYDYKGQNGSTFKALYENVRNWTRYPAAYPYNTSGTPSATVRIMAHDDILHALWPHPESAWLLANFPTGSIRDNFGMRQAVLAYRYRPLYG
jgi:hypothetical protein